MIDLDEFDDVLRVAMVRHTDDCRLPPGAAQRALRAAKRSRRRQQVLAASGGLVLVGGAMMLMPVLPSGSGVTTTASRSAMDREAVIPQTALAGYPLNWDLVPAGVVTELLQGADGSRQVMWVSKGGRLVLGRRDAGASTTEPLLSRPLSDFQDPGMWQLMAMSHARTGGTRSALLGLVRGPGTAVFVDLPGRRVQARLVNTPDQAARIYWVTFSDADLASMPAPSDPGSGTLPRTATSFGISVLDGDRAVFRCPRGDCLGPFGPASPRASMGETDVP